MLFKLRMTMSTIFLVALVAGCRMGDAERVDPEDAGVGPEPGFNVLVDTSTTPPGGVPGAGAGTGGGGGAAAPGAAGAGAAGTSGDAGTATGTPR